jgi:hypothetical protein
MCSEHPTLLSQEYDTDTMSRLLCVSRNICAATLPFLYGDCFNFNMHKSRNYEENPFVIQLMRTLLRQVHPRDRIPSLLQVAYLSQDAPDDLLSPVFEWTFHSQDRA